MKAIRKGEINTVFFKSLSGEEKTKFKEVANLLSYIIIGQKKKMMEEYFNQLVVLLPTQTMPGA
jgi:hypothetical protein